MSKRGDAERKPSSKRKGKKDGAGVEPAQKKEPDIQPRNGPRVDPTDPVEEASWESFPASDPPSFNPGRANGS